MKGIMWYIIPPPSWRIPVILILGIFTGFVVLLFHLSKAGSYLTNDPEACVNCHIMSPHYATWSHSSHRESATCNDCHVPRNNLINTYYFKAKDGLRHATIFTLRKEPQVIFIRDEGRDVVQKNCIWCHGNLMAKLNMGWSDQNDVHETDRLCWECHREVPHGRVNSLSSVLYARIPLPESPVPLWLREILQPK